MERQPDFRELLELFNEQKVEYPIVGGYALAFRIGDALKNMLGPDAEGVAIK